MSESPSTSNSTPPASADAMPMSGATVLVTGGTSGIGGATAAALAALGARVAIVGRDAQRAQAHARAIAAQTPGAQVDVFVADLSAQAQVRELADRVLAAYPRLDVLVNNAGGYWNSRQVTVDGIERTLAVDHLAPFLLTNLLLDRLRASAPARVVTVSSGAQAMGRIDFEDLQGERRYRGQRAYAQAKLANIMFTYELARRLAGSGVTANVLHPGVVRTGFGQEDAGAAMRLTIRLTGPFMKSPQQGARTSVYLASSPQVEGVTGQYFVDAKPRRSCAASYDEAAATRLWQVSAQLVGLSQ